MYNIYKDAHEAVCCKSGELYKEDMRLLNVCLCSMEWKE
jgi:hypothetical protein